MDFGTKTWKDHSFTDLIHSERKRNRIIGLTFPEQNLNLGLEPSVLMVMPQDAECEYSMLNIDFNDDDVQYYLCSVYISGMKEFKEWARRHNIDKIVVGGYHPTSFPDEFKHLAYKIVLGPCDDFWATINQFGQIVNGITSYKNKPRYDLYNMRNNQQVIPDKMPSELCTSVNTITRMSI